MQKKTKEVDYKALKDVLESYYDSNQSKLTVIFYSMLGELVECDEGSYVSAGCENGQGFMLYGPYKQYEKGSYSVNFSFKSTYGKTNDKAKDIVCFADVVTNQGNTILAKQEIRYSEIAENPNVKLTFSLQKEEVLEFRVFTYAKVPLLVSVNPEAVKI